MEKTKLTLRIEKPVIESAKQYAQHHHTSLSKLVAEFLRALKITEEAPAAPILEELSGILPPDVSLAKREPHYTPAAAVWALVEQEKVEGLLAAHTVTTLHYLVTKYLDRRQANLTMTRLLQVFAIAAVDQAVLLRAQTLNWPVFEDAGQMAAVFSAQVDYLVTRNPKDFRDELVRVIQPGDLLTLYAAS